MRRIELKGKNVLITGASSGIGKELAKCFAQEGAHLALSSLPAEQDTLAAVAGDLEKKCGITTRIFPVDLAVDEGPLKLYEQVNENIGTPDVLVNNAGVMAYGLFNEMTVERQELLIRINAVAYFKLMKLFLPGMVSRKTGSILNVVSMAAFNPTPHHAVYGATKAFIQSLSEAVAEELRGTGIEIFTLNPSYVDTPLIHSNEFPESLRFYKMVKASSPAFVAEQAVASLKAGRPICIPGFMNKLIYVNNKIMPRKLLNKMTFDMLRP